MSRLGGWIRANVKGDGNSEAAIAAAAEKERADMADAMEQAQMIMNDDIDGAYKALRKGDSSFHRFGSTVAFFMRSVLGMEKQVMSETSDMLNDCETRAWDDVKAAERRGPREDSIYPPGTEYKLIQAEVQLMGAVVGVLHESLVEAMKSFYKLRKAFITLDNIITIEAKVLGEAKTTEAFNPHDVNGTNGTNGKSGMDDGDSDSEEFVDAKEGPSDPVTPAEPAQPVTKEAKPEAGLGEDTKRAIEEKTLLSTQPNSRIAETKELVFTDPIDIFIHSGANMCFGILMLILTLVPPSFARILSVVGFRGDRAKGVSMLWRSSTHENVNGAVAGMMLLAYYNALLGTVDIIPHSRDYDEEAETVGPPREKCQRLLASMRERYPDSRLWQVEESRRLSSERDLRAAIHVLQTGKPAKMQQVTALNDFELAIVAMMAQDWTLMRDSFMKCAETNDWSPALYWFLAGVATLELYRDAVQAGDEGEARRQKKKADAYLRKAPTMAGKKRFMAGKLPFEQFLQRKLQRWEERANELGVDMVDAVGPGPAVELGYMWNGSKRMGDKELAAGVENTSWDRCTCGQENVKKMKAEEDEMGTWAVCMSAFRRRQGRYQEARELLEQHVMQHDRAIFKGPTKNDYVLASATYELGAIAWEECCHPPEGCEDVMAYRQEKLEECESYLDKVKNWENFILDMRIGLRVQSGLETIRWFKGRMGWA